jgi:hypothetical protein
MIAATFQACTVKSLALTSATCLCADFMQSGLTACGMPCAMRMQWHKLQLTHVSLGGGGRRGTLVSSVLHDVTHLLSACLPARMYRCTYTCRFDAPQLHAPLLAPWFACHNAHVQCPSADVRIAIVPHHAMQVDGHIQQLAAVARSQTRRQQPGESSSTSFEA